MNALETLLKRVSACSVNATQFDGAIGDVAFDLATWDGFVAGIATSLLSHRRPSPEDEAILRGQFRLREVFWTTETGAQVDLRGFESLLTYARVIDELRSACVAHQDRRARPLS